MHYIDSGNCLPQVRLVYGSDPLGRIGLLSCELAEFVTNLSYSRVGELA